MTTIVLPASNTKGTDNTFNSISSSYQHHSLRRWMTHYHPRRPHAQNQNDNTTSDATNPNDNQLLSPTPPPILILDGGVSTHLERKLQDGTSETTTPTFSHRELWSSSLLLAPRGRTDIRSAHVEFFDAGCDVIGTVTYQCSHHGCDGDSHRRSRNGSDGIARSCGGARDGENDGADDEHNLESTSSVSPDVPRRAAGSHRFEEEDIDAMLRMGVQLANQARHQSYRDRDITTAAVAADTTTNVSGTHAHHFNTTKHKYIAASMGCYGAALANGEEYTGDYGDACSMEDLVRFHRRRFDLFWDMALSNSASFGGGEGGDDADNERIEEGLGSGDIDSGICSLDALAFETVPCLMEVKAILHLLRDRSSTDNSRNPSQEEDIETLQMPQVGRSYDKNNLRRTSSDAAVWISLACRDGQHLNDGTLLMEALDAIDAMDPEGTMVHGVGINCVAICYVQSLITILAAHQLRSKSNRAIIFYPNSGEQWDPIRETWREGSGCTNPEQFALEVVNSIRIIYNMCTLKDKDAGVMPILVGGCCRTSPSTIAAVRQLVDKFLE